MDQRQLKLNSVIAAALAPGFANDDARLAGKDHAGIERLIESQGLEPQMRNFGVWRHREAGERGRHD